MKGLAREASEYIENFNKPLESTYKNYIEEFFGRDECSESVFISPTFSYAIGTQISPYTPADAFLSQNQNALHTYR